MIISAFLALSGATPLDEVVGAARSLESAGVESVGILDATDTGGCPVLFESTTLAVCVATMTSTIGVVASNSALYGFPYHTTRRLATIDHLSAGRSGWLLRTVTGADEVTAYDWRSAAGRGEELHRATEYAEIALELWDSWEDGAQWPDKATGDFKDDGRIHPIDYRSTSFRVAGPLDVPPCPQRRPVLFAEIGTPLEAVHLAPYVDVAILVAPGPAALAGLAEAVRDTAPSTTILLAGAIDGAAPAMAAADAVPLVEPAGAAGVALYLTPAAVASATALAGDLKPAPDAEPGTLAGRLGLESAFTLGGSAA